jgi:hypothetical protein
VVGGAARPSGEGAGGRAVEDGGWARVGLRCSTTVGGGGRIRGGR